MKCREGVFVLKIKHTFRSHKSSQKYIFSCLPNWFFGFFGLRVCQCVSVLAWNLQFSSHVAVANFFTNRHDWQYWQAMTLHITFFSQNRYTIAHYGALYQNFGFYLLFQTHFFVLVRQMHKHYTWVRVHL